MGDELEWVRATREARVTLFFDICLWLMGAIVAVIAVYTVRHFIFTLNRLFGRQRHPYVDVAVARWPRITVAIPAHNEELVIGNILEALLAGDYPREQMTILPVNDRSTDRTREIVDDYAARYPGLIVPLHRTDGPAGKAAALRDATELARGEILIVFDADYTPGKGLLRQLVAPFFDPRVGAVMGRVVPLNAGRNMLTRLLDLERTAGYQVDQQARMNLRLVPQYGGTVGGVRLSALRDIGGWREDTLTEDTDVTYRLLLCGWETAYQNRSECYEEVPEEWPVRIRQIARWTEGHNQALRDHAGAVALGHMGGLAQRIDALLLLGVYAVAPLTVAGWVLTITLWYGGHNVTGWVAFMVVASYNTLGNFAAFFEVAAAARLDGTRQRVRLLPFLFAGYLVSLSAVFRGMMPGRRGPKQSDGRRRVVWEKTRRYCMSGPFAEQNRRAAQ
jgi:cellulose synthase/poly-beta-1,6-N-acetylglucosamine synthase-like glycosyltransferase